MTVLRRILKYTPVVVLGLLVVAWVASVYFFVGARFFMQASGYRFFLSHGSIHCDNSPTPAPVAFFVCQVNERVRYPEDVLGRFRFRTQRISSGAEFDVTFPLLTAVTLALPFAVGSLAGFRFRLWHCLAYSSLVAIELSFQSQADRFPFEPSEMGWISAFLAALVISLVYLNRRWRLWHTA